MAAIFTSNFGGNQNLAKFKDTSVQLGLAARLLGLRLEALHLLFDGVHGGD